MFVKTSFRNWKQREKMEDMQHLLSRKEIMNLQPGRVLDSLISEYVLAAPPTRWDTVRKENLISPWFSKLIGVASKQSTCIADTLAKYSEDDAAAMRLCECDALKDKPINITTKPGTPSRWEVSFGFHLNPHIVVSGETLALAVCRAALLATSCRP